MNAVLKLWVLAPRRYWVRVFVYLFVVFCQFYYPS
jgi:hypothetical protein